MNSHLSENQEYEGLYKKTQISKHYNPSSYYQSSFTDKMYESQNFYEEFQIGSNDGYSILPRNSELQKQEELEIDQNFNDVKKKKIVYKIFKLTKNLPLQDADEKVKSIANLINVQLGQLRLWMVAYKIVFGIEEANKTSTLSHAQVMSRIQKGILQFMINNKREKKYRVIKILSLIFKNFGMSEGRVSNWLNHFVSEKYQELKGMDFSQYGQRRIENTHEKPDYYHNQIDKVYQEKQESILQDFPKRKRGRPRKSQLLQRQVNIFSTNTEELSISGFPLAFKQKIALSLDNNINNLFKQKSEELCIPQSMLRTIHNKFGTKDNRSAQNCNRRRVIESLNYPIQTGKKNCIMKPAVKNSLYGPSRPTQAYYKRPSNPEPASLLARLDLALLNFLRSNQFCPIALLEKEADSFMVRLRFPVSLKNEVRNRWFSFFLKKNKLTLSKEKTIFYENANPSVPKPRARHPSSPVRQDEGQKPNGQRQRQKKGCRKN